MDIIAQLTINSIVAGSLYTLIAVGFNLNFNASKFYNLSYGSMIAVGGYLVFAFTHIYGLSLWIALPIALIATSVLELCIYKTIYEPMRKHNASSLVLLIASFGVLLVMTSVLAMIFTSRFKSLADTSELATRYTVLGGSITQIQVIIIIVSVVIVSLLALALSKSKFGKAVRAISDDEEVSKIIGINTDKVLAGVFMLSASIAALGGTLIGFDTGIFPTLGFWTILKGIIAAIIGGLGSLPGAVIGAYILGFAENFGIWPLSGSWKDAIAFGLLIIFLILRPQGLIKK